MYISIRFFFAQIPIKKFLERKAGENTEKYSIFNFENPLISRISGGRNDQVAVKFRVLFALGTFVSAVVGGGSFGNGENPCAATDFGRADRY